MSEAFRCDGCDEYYGGTPTTISIGLEHGVVGDSVTLGHFAGRDDAHPRDDEPEHIVEWPFHDGGVELCATCTASYVVPGVQEAAQQGRYDD
jgi:hypothetical protein